jgi:hypothetical protein
VTFKVKIPTLSHVERLYVSCFPPPIPYRAIPTEIELMNPNDWDDIATNRWHHKEILDFGHKEVDLKYQLHHN